MPNVNIDPVSAHETFAAWKALPDTYTGKVRMSGTRVLDGSAYGLLKAEFMAATAGVVPFIPLPGGGQGVMTVGGALAQPASAWPSKPLHQLYMLNQAAYADLHGRVERARPGTPALAFQPISPTQAQQLALQFNRVGVGAASIGFLPAVGWVVIAAVGILATIAGTWYAIRTKEEEIQLAAESARNAAKIGSLTDLATTQLATTGKIDPHLIDAIRKTGEGTLDGAWPYVALGAGGVIILAGGAYIALSLRKRRR